MGYMMAGGGRVSGFREAVEMVLGGLAFAALLWLGIVAVIILGGPAG